MGRRRLALYLAWERTVTQLAGSYGRGATSAVLAISVGYGAFGVSFWLRRDWPGDELIPLYATGAVFILLWILVLLYNWLFSVPYDQWGNAELRVEELEDKLTPRLTFTLENDGRTREFPVGTLNQVASGGYVSNQTGHEQFICARVFNDSSAETSCEFILTEFTNESGKQLGDPVVLGWRNGRYRGGTEYFTARTRRTALIFRITAEGQAYLATAEAATMDQLQFMRDSNGPFIGRIALGNSSNGTLLIDFKLSLEPEPQMSILAATPA